MFANTSQQPIDDVQLADAVVISAPGDIVHSEQYLRVVIGNPLQRLKFALAGVFVKDTGRHLVIGNAVRGMGDEIYLFLSQLSDVHSFAAPQQFQIDGVLKNMADIGRRTRKQAEP